MSLIGTTAVTQGPQRTTVSSVVMEDERRILKSLRDIKDLLNHFNPSLTTKFSIKSLLTLDGRKHIFRNEEVVPLTCPYSLNSITDSVGKPKNGWRGNVLHHLFTSQLPTPGFHHHILQWFTQLCPRKAYKLSEKQVSERGTGERCMVRVSPRKQCETWQQRTIQELCP